MPGVDVVTAERLDRVLGFLSISGGAALVSTRDRRVVGAIGDVDERAVGAALAADIEPDDATVHLPPGILVANVRPGHRLLVIVPRAQLDPAFSDRTRRARDLIERYRLYRTGFEPQSPPPGDASANAFLFLPRPPKLRD